MSEFRKLSVSRVVADGVVENMAQRNSRATEHLVRALGHLDSAVRALEQAFQELPPSRQGREADSEAVAAALEQFRKAACNLIH